MPLLQPFVLPSPACPLTWVPPHGTQTLPSVQPSQPYMESISQFTMEALHSWSPLEGPNGH